MSISKDARIYIPGHRGLAGSAVWRRFEQQGFRNLIGRTHGQLELMDTRAVDDFFEKERPEYVIVTAARVGGILANNRFPASFLYENLQIQNNLIHTSYRYGIQKLLFLGSSCIYPKHAPQPIKEEYLLSGALEPTNESYAIAKIAGMKMCQAYRRQYGCDFISLMPTNLYGPNDNYNLETSHVLPAFIRRFHEAKIAGVSQVVCWGSGMPRREFLHSDDLASAIQFLLENYSEEGFINVGSSTDVTIQELAETVKNVVGFKGKIEWDTTKPDGTPRKLMDSSRLLEMGWNPAITLRDGIQKTYQHFLQNFALAV